MPPRNHMGRRTAGSATTNICISTSRYHVCGRHQSTPHSDRKLLTYSTFFQTLARQMLHAMIRLENLNYLFVCHAYPTVTWTVERGPMSKNLNKVLWKLSTIM